jgi:hypothetical protein
MLPIFTCCESILTTVLVLATAAAVEKANLTTFATIRYDIYALLHLTQSCDMARHTSIRSRSELGLAYHFMGPDDIIWGGWDGGSGDRTF